jgi:hypothetical protein
VKATRRLFEVPPAEFTAARNALVRELRDAGKADEAKEVAALRRPAATLWIANQLGPRHRAQVEELIEATRKLEKVQAAAGGDLREAMQEQRSALQKVMEKVDALARQIEARVTPELQRRVQTTVTSAAASDPEALVEGTLERELEASGFGDLLGKAPAARTHAAVHHAPPARADKGTGKAAKKAAKAAEKRAEAAAARARADRQRALQKAEKRAAQLDRRARVLEKRATEARAAADRAGTQAADARSRADAAASEALGLRRPEA